MWQESAHKVIVLFSSGVESTCLLHLYLEEGRIVYPLYIKVGYPWEALEFQKAKSLWMYYKKLYKKLMTLRVIPLMNPEPPNRRSHTKDLYIPLRNLSLITSASLYATLKKVNSIAIGSLGIYPFPDNNVEYMRSLQKLTGVTILTPFMGLHKHEVIRQFWGKVPFEKTFSCIEPRKVKGKILPCGRCEKCKEREEAFKHL